MKKILRLTTTIIVLLFLGGNAWGQIISQYVETNSGSIPKGIEIWNNTASALDFSANSLIIQQGTNGGALADLSGTLITSGTLASNAVLVIGTSDIGTYLTDQGHTSVTFVDYGFSFNGNDALAVKYGGSVTDIFGLAGNDPGSAWTGNDVSTANQNIQLVSGITAGDTDGWTDPSTRFETICTDNCLTGFGVAPSAGATPSISVFPSTLTGFTYIEGSGPSAEQSFTVEGSNLTHDISIAATTNYQISTGTGGSFSATTPITLTQSGGSVATTTIYVRLKAGLGVGSYNSEVITATSTGADNKTVTCSGSVTPIPAPGYLVDFEGTGETKGSYASGTVNLSGLDWDLTEALIGSEASDWKNGTRSARMRGYAASAMTMLADKSNGVGTVSFNYRRYVTDAQVDWKVEYTTNAGSNWTQIGSDFTAPDSDDVQLFSEVVDVAGNIRIRIKRATETGSANNRLNIDDISITDYSSGVSVPIVTTPTATSITDVSATLGGNITSDGGSSITERGTVWKTSAGVTITDNKLAEGGTSTGVFTHSRSSLPSGSQIFYRAYATNVIGTTLSDESSFYTLASEPSAHPTGFTATANSSSEITVNWTDANPAADAYLIKGSDVSYGAIDAPVDGTAEANSTLVQNVTSGVQTFQFTGLAASTTYYFKIYPYNGSATTVNYKTDETIEQATATTEAYAGASLIISEVADPITYQGRFVEIYNADDTDIDFDNETWYLSKQSNGSSESWADIQLTGTIAAGSTYVIAYGTDFSNFYSAYGLVPDMSSGSISGNGDDGYFLYSGGNHASGTLVDAYGAINEDGSGKPWEYGNSKAVRLNTINTPNTTWTDSEWNIISSCDVNRMTPLLHPATAWNGDAAKSSDWTAVANWDNGLPGALISAKIPSNLTTYPTIASAATVNILWLGDGATLLGGENLTVNGTAFFEKQIAGYSAVGEPDGWYAIAPPVSGSIATSTFVPIENEDDFYVYDQATNYWLNYFDASNPPALFDNFDPGTGYLVAYAPANAGLLIAAGTLNAAASYSPALSNSNTAWNLIGNPYPSNVTWADVTKTLVSSPKIMNVNTGAWEDMGSEVEVGQGIFVYAEDGSASITFETADHTHASGLKEVSAQLTFKALFADNLDVKLLLQINNEATTNYEWQHDARYFYPVTTIPYLCATTDDQVWVSKYVFSPGGQTTIIPLHFTVAQSQSITFALDNFTKDAGISRMTLEDTFANKFVELSEGDTYTFTADPSDDPDRFKLHAVTTTGITESTIDGISIYANGNSLYLNSNAARTAQVEMYNVTGQLTFSKKVSLGGLTQITPQFTTGWYIVKVRTQQGVATQKVFIKSNQ